MKLFAAYRTWNEGNNVLISQLKAKEERQVKRNCLKVQSLQRALDILEVVGKSEQPVALKEIAVVTGLPKSTVYRLLSNLEEREYVRCNVDASYQLGLRLLLLAQQAATNS